MTDRDSAAPAFYDEVDTPALVLDKAKLSATSARMAEFVAGGPAKLRPHAKTHKCVEIAQLQLDAGAVGITCAKVGEAEALADGGIPDILIANQIVGPLKIARLVELAKRCAVTVAVDDAEQRAPALGGRRRGRRHAPRATSRSTSAWTAAAWSRASPRLALARQVAAAAGLLFAGSRPTKGHLQNLVPFEERRARTQADMRKALDRQGVHRGRRARGGGTSAAAAPAPTRSPAGSPG